MSSTTSTESDFYIRELKLSDYENGFIECLKALTVVGDITKDKFEQTLSSRQKTNIYTIVAIDKKTNKVIGTGSMFYELKFIRNCSKKAYIEDIAVLKETQGRGVGREIVLFLENKALNDGCYKIVLTCDEKVAGFYRKMNFKKVEEAMAIYASSLD